MNQVPLSLYEMTPSMYDKYIDTQIERRNFDEVFRRIVEKRKDEQISILDFCCGTAIFARNWLANQEGIHYIGVDTNNDFLSYARARLPNDRFQFCKADAVAVDLCCTFDVVMATSGYHHIQDDRKKAFLLNMKKHKNEQGIAIIYEKFVAPYGDDPLSKARSGTQFYAERIFDMLQSEPLTPEQLFALYNEMFLTSIRRDEFKVTLDHFLSDAKSSGFLIENKTKVWPLDDRFQNPDVGDFVISMV